MNYSAPFLQVHVLQRDPVVVLGSLFLGSVDFIGLFSYLVNTGTR